MIATKERFIDCGSHWSHIGLTLVSHWSHIGLTLVSHWSVHSINSGLSGLSGHLTAESDHSNQCQTNEAFQWCVNEKRYKGCRLNQLVRLVSQSCRSAIDHFQLHWLYMAANRNWHQPKCCTADVGSMVLVKADNRLTNAHKFEFEGLRQWAQGLVDRNVV